MTAIPNTPKQMPEAHLSPLHPLDTPPSDEEVLQALQRVLASPAFVRAWRLGRLLSHLVHRALAAEHRELSEFSIGLAVFDRRPEDFRTLADPIVRVQVGRLRQKLRAFYRNTTDPGGIYILIPQGRYVPDFLRLANGKAPEDTSQRLEISVRCLDDDAEGDRFALGLESELTHGMFQRLGHTVLLVSPDVCMPVIRRPARFQLLGQVRVDAAVLRVSTRLVRSADGGVLWTAHYDPQRRDSITAEAELARRVCEAVAPELVTHLHHEDGEPSVQPDQQRPVRP